MKKSKLFKSISMLVVMATIFSGTSLNAFAENSHIHKTCGNVSHEECYHGNDAFMVFEPEVIFDASTNRIKPGNYYLDRDINLNDLENFHGGIDNGTVTICLNGHTITPESLERVFVVYQRGTLNLCDCTGNGKIMGGGIINLGKFNMYGGEITGVTATPVENYVAGTFTMYGGKIANNDCQSIASGVYNMGNFIMKNGEITNNNNTQHYYENSNTYNGGDAGAVYNTGYFEMADGKITNNGAVECGGVYNATNNAVFKVYGGTVSGNYLLHSMDSSVTGKSTDIYDVNNNTVYVNNQNGDNSNNNTDNNDSNTNETSDLNYVSLFYGSASSSNWGQAVSVLTTKHGGSFDASNIKPGGHFYLEYKGTQDKVELILQSWSGAASWGKVTVMESGTANGNYFVKFSYDACVNALGTSDFVGMLDQIHVGAMDTNVEVVSLCYDFSPY